MDVNFDTTQPSKLKLTANKWKVIQRFSKVMPIDLSYTLEQR